MPFAGLSRPLALCLALSASASLGFSNAAQAGFIYGRLVLQDIKVIKMFLSLLHHKRKSIFLSCFYLYYIHKRNVNILFIITSFVL